MFSVVSHSQQASISGPVGFIFKLEAAEVVEVVDVVVILVAASIFEVTIDTGSLSSVFVVASRFGSRFSLRPLLMVVVP